MKTLLELPNFPVSVCTQSIPFSADEILMDARIVEDERGFVRFEPYVDPKLIYISQHNSSIGSTWELHNEKFANFIYTTEKNKVVDIGGGTGNIYSAFTNLNPSVDWTIIDFNPPQESAGLKVIKGLYDSKMINEGDTVVTSHFIEHLYDLEEFLIRLSERKPAFHIFSLPNFSAYARNNYCSTIMFEHPNFLSEDCLKFILASTGWEIVEKEYYKDHSIFFKTKRASHVLTPDPFSVTHEVTDFIEHIKNRVNSVKGLNGFYVFGAHFPLYYLLSLGVKESQILGVVDNDQKKQNKRMYGTNLKVYSPRDIPEKSSLFVEMGPYNDEIKHDLNEKNFIYI